MRKSGYLSRTSVTKQELVKEFLERKRLSGISPTALEDQKGILRRFFEYYKGNFADETKLRKVMLEYMLDKRADHHNKTLSCLRAYFALCIDEGLLSSNPCQGMKFKPSATRIVDLDESTIKEFLKLPNTRTFSGLRDYTFMIFLLDTACRPHEALQIRLKDIQDGFVIIREMCRRSGKNAYCPCHCL